MPLLSNYLSSLDSLLTRTQCNEVHPVCGSCARHKVPCIYDPSRSNPVTFHHEVIKGSNGSRSASSTRESRGEIKREIGGQSRDESSTPNTEGAYPESEKRRLLELRLLNHWMMKSALSFPGSEHKVYRESMTIDNLQSSLRHHSLLYVNFTFTALHISKLSQDPREKLEFQEVHRKYLDLALKEHRLDLENMDKPTADVICMTSSMIRNTLLATLQDRALLPYVPPTEWLRMMTGSGDVFIAAWDWVKDDPKSIARELAQRGPDLSDLNTLFGESNRQALNHLLHRNPVDEIREPWNADIQKTYERTLSYIGGIKIAIDNGESPSDICRRLVAFTMFMPRHFIDLLDERQPRALVVLAYYFALLARLRDTWWIGDTGRREVVAINGVLEDRWLPLMRWPLVAMEEKSVMVSWEYD